MSTNYYWRFDERGREQAQSMNPAVHIGKTASSGRSNGFRFIFAQEPEEVSARCALALLDEIIVSEGGDLLTGADFLSLVRNAEFVRHSVGQAFS